MTRRVLSALVLSAALLGCNPYDPDLGDAPFRCAVVEPRCPDGYGAVEAAPPAFCTCEKGQKDSPLVYASPGVDSALDSP